MKNLNKKNHCASRLLLFLWAVVILLAIIFKDGINAESILALIPEPTLGSALVLLALFAVKSISVVFYSGILYAVSGIIFPVPAALLINILGSVIMISIPYYIGKKAGSEMLTKLVEKHPKLAALQSIQNQSQVMTCALARLVHILPSDPVSMYFGASGVKPLPHIIGSILGLTPMFVSFMFMGVSINDPKSPVFILSLVVQLLFILSSLPLYRRIIKKSKNRDGEAEAY